MSQQHGYKTQAEYRRDERRRWQEMSQLADAGDAAGFWGKYAEYLEARGIHSTGRNLLYKMARFSADRLS